MKTETIIWLVVLVLAGAFLAYRATVSHEIMGKSFVKVTDVQPETANGQVSWQSAEPVPPKDRDKPSVQLSVSRTVGTWIAALLTLAIFSFLYRDNPIYKFAESLFIGVSAAYWMVVAFWNVVIPNLLGNLFPSWIQSWAMPGLPEETQPYSWFYWIPLVLGLMLLWRLSPKGGWISRWPLAFIIGTVSGLRLVQFLHADFLSQIRNGIMPLVSVVHDAGGAVSAYSSFWASLANIVMIVGVLACITYFFFSVEHKGAVGKFSRVGIWILMITFGAMFGYTVMGRIALLAARLEFLFDDWLWLIDPTGHRSNAVVAIASHGWHHLA